MEGVSHPDKVLYPADGITKGEVVDYYRTVSDAMLPHLEGRPLTLQRFPNGIDESGFMQKNAPGYFPESIERVEVPKEGGTTVHPLCDSVEDLVYLANQNTITFHIWTARLPLLERPDRLVLDLDPPKGGDPPREAARAAREVMEDIGLSPGIMTTGSSGYHVVALIEQEHDYDAVGRAARLLAGVVAARHPDETTTEFLKKDRAGRVFVDWLRNRWAQSTVCPWSLRPRPGAPVAMPISWDELDDTDPQRWNLQNAPERLGLDDPWPVASPLDLEAVQGLAEAHDVSADEPFDRFGRKR
ncbi:MAG TPA: non-homologous end-joining DNA ligase [Acidimicrobiia bacterium]|nr:non-homologous end-joining DNA ligase [Acidimicrobiia bacterium]